MYSKSSKTTAPTETEAPKQPRFYQSALDRIESLLSENPDVLTKLHSLGLNIYVQEIRELAVALEPHMVGFIETKIITETKRTSRTQANDERTPLLMLNILSREEQDHLIETFSPHVEDKKHALAVVCINPKKPASTHIVIIEPQGETDDPIQAGITLVDFYEVDADNTPIPAAFSQFPPSKFPEQLIQIYPGQLPSTLVPATESGNLIACVRPIDLDNSHRVSISRGYAPYGVADSPVSMYIKPEVLGIPVRSHVVMTNVYYQRFVQCN